MTAASLNPRDYYRLPWSLNDNILHWLEPTKRCNLYCEGCYSRNDKSSDKSLAQIRSDLDVFTANRTADSVSITGGDPLMHPEIVEIVRIIKDEYGLKPVVNTNGLALTPELLHDLKEAGAFGFTFHIDSSQVRPGWKDKNDLELAELRLHYAEMVAAEGGLTTSFNATVFPHTMQHVPAMMDWAREHADIVHIMVFILFRTTRTKEFDYFAKGEKIDSKELVYYDEDKLPNPITAPEIVAKIRETEPMYEPSAFLGGTKDPNSFKWLMASRITDRERTFGYVGKRFQEAVQTGHHVFTGKYLAYSDPKALKRARSTMLGGSVFDPGMRKAAAEWGKSLLSSPLKAASPLYLQTIMIIQPIDMMPDGESNMCDGCPDMTVHNGELVWSCRLEERLKYGCFLTSAPKNAEEQTAETAAQQQADPPAKESTQSSSAS